MIAFTYSDIVEQEQNNYSMSEDNEFKPGVQMCKRCIIQFSKCLTRCTTPC